MRLLCVLGASEALADHLCRHPEHWRELTDPTLGSTRPAAYAVREGLLARGRRRPARPGADRHRAGRRGRGRAAGRVPPGPAPAGLPRPGPRPRRRRRGRRALRPRGRHPGGRARGRPAAGGRDGARPARLAVIAMGKCGGHELNYVSDVDVIFVLRAGRRRRTTRPRAQGRDPAGQPPDAGLLRAHRRRARSGRSTPACGPRARPVRWSGPSPATGLLRAVGRAPGSSRRCSRPAPVAGDLELGRQYVEMVAPMVWSAAERDGFVEDTQAMRRRVVEHIPAHQAERQLKLGSGGLRDVEFAVQLLQLVHGRADERIRQPTTLSALAELTRRRLRRPRGRRGAARRLRVPAHPRAPDPAATGCAAPTWYPRTSASLRRLGRSMGYTKDPVATLDKTGSTTGARCAGCTRSCSTGRCSPPWPGCPAPRPGSRPEAAGQRLAALGFADPDAALRHLEALTAGVTRTANIQRHAAAGDARLVRRGARPGRRAVRLPPDQRVARPDAVVPQDPARRGRGRPAAGHAARHLPLRHRPARERAAGRADAGGGPRAARPPRSLTEEMLAAGGRRDDAEEAVARDPRAYAVASCSGSRPATLLGLTDVADVGAGAVPAHRRHPRGDAGGGAATRSAAPRRPRRRADPDGDRRDGPLRRLRAVLRQRRRRAVRARARGGRRPARGGVVRPGRGQRAAPAARAARRRPAAGGRRGPAARGQAGAAGAQPRVVRGVLREVVEGLGGAGAAPRRRRGRRPGPAAAVRGADRPAALPGGRAVRGRRGRGTPDQGAGRQGAAAARRRPARATSSSAGAGWPTSSGPCSCCRCGTPAEVPGPAHLADPRGARPPRARPGSSSRPTPTS